MVFLARTPSSTNLGGIFLQTTCEWQLRGRLVVLPVEYSKQINVGLLTFQRRFSREKQIT